MAAETGFLIDGTVYEVPALDGLTMSERNVMYGLCGFVQEDFLQEEDESDDDHEVRVRKLMRHPGFMQALMAIAYQRGNPTVKPGKVKLVIEDTNYFDAIETLGEEAEPEDDAVPLALTTPPDDPSPSSPSSKNDSTALSSANGGTDSTSALEELVAVPTSIGHGRSAISSPGSPPTESVA